MYKIKKWARWKGWTKIPVTVGVLSLLATLYFTSQTLVATQRQSGATENQVRIAEQGQYTDRFGKAVEQLGQPGAEKVDVRLGGIYALQHLVRNTSDYQPTVMKLLTAFIRTHAPAEQSCPRDKGSKPPEDIQAALSVVAQRDPQWDGPGRLDLTHTCLTGARLFQANLRDADLSYAVLFNADLNGAELSDSTVFHSDLREASVDYTRLFGVDLHSTDVRGVDLSKVVGLK